MSCDHHVDLSISKDDEASDTKLSSATESDLDKAVQIEVDRRNFTRAVMLAQKLGYPDAQIRHLQELALKQVACDYRNGLAVRNLVQEWGFSKAEIESLLLKAVAEHESSVGMARSDKCYDAATGKYLTLRQWVEQFLNTKK